MHVKENPAFTRDYFDPAKRAIPNAVRVLFKDGSSTARFEVSYPLGHRRRRSEGIPLLIEKFKKTLARFPAEQSDRILDLCENQERFEATPGSEFLGSWTV